MSANHIVYTSCDVRSSVCSLITTHFAKVFDGLDHTVAVQCLLDLEMKAGLISWICSIITDHCQKVRYQGHLSSWKYPISEDNCTRAHHLFATINRMEVTTGKMWMILFWQAVIPYSATDPARPGHGRTQNEAQPKEL